MIEGGCEPFERCTPPIVDLTAIKLLVVLFYGFTVKIMRCYDYFQFLFPYLLLQHIFILRPIAQSKYYFQCPSVFTASLFLYWYYIFFCPPMFLQLIALYHFFSCAFFLLLLLYICNFLSIFGAY